MRLLLDSIYETIQISTFVLSIMLIIEYLNIYTRGRWRIAVSNKWLQYLIGIIMGLMPGCLGSFFLVTLYTHRIVSFGTLLGGMIATTGDETFVMLAVIPKLSIFLFILLGIIGYITGVITDLILRRDSNNNLFGHEIYYYEAIHQDPECRCLPESKREFLEQIKNITIARFVLTIILSTTFIFIMVEIIEKGWDSIKITSLILSILSLGIIITVPEHFLKEHLWNHIFKHHLPKLFGWILGVSIVINLFLQYLGLIHNMRYTKWIFLLISGLTGLIPTSGPHIVFINMAAQGVIPFSILLTNSIVQEGHGLLPLLGESRKKFILIKGIKFLIAIIIGSGLLLAGF